MNDKIKYVNNPSFLLMNHAEPEAHSDGFTDMMFVLISNNNSLNIRFWEENAETALMFSELCEYAQQTGRTRSSSTRKSSSGNNRALSGPSLDSLSEYCSGNSGPYRHNCCTYTLKNMKPNTRYLCIVSTFHALDNKGQLEYDLEFLSTKSPAISIQQLAPSGAWGL